VTDTALTRDVLVSTISDVTGVSREDIHDSTDLFSLGLDSLGVMRLVNECRVHGLPVTFADLADDPTLGAWWARISQLLRANPHLAA
jgi:mycobactin phenyloxazoline synthetase